jgi:hypothetical protein
MMCPCPPDAATTQAGDLWVLGNHRLLCGDSSKPEDVDRLLDGARIHLVNTDPPYNVKVEPRSNNAIAAGLSFATKRGAINPRGMHHQEVRPGRHRTKAKPTQKKLRAKDRPLANDFVTDEAFDQMLDAWFGNMARVLEDGRGFYIWGGYANLGNYPPFLKKHELYFSQAIVWDKQHPVLTRKDFMGNHEMVLLRLEGRARPQVLRPQQRDRPVARQEGQPAVDGPPDGEARRAGGAGDAVFSLAGENVLDLFGGIGQHADRRRADGAAGVPHGTRHAVLRCDRAALGEVHREEGGTDRGECRRETVMPEKTPAGGRGGRGAGMKARSDHLVAVRQGVVLDHRVEVDVLGRRVAVPMADLDQAALLEEFERDVDLGEGEVFLADDAWPGRCRRLRGASRRSRGRRSRRPAWRTDGCRCGRRSPILRDDPHQTPILDEEDDTAIFEAGTHGVSLGLLGGGQGEEAATGFGEAGLAGLVRRSSRSMAL